MTDLQLLIVAHTPSVNLERLAQALCAGANSTQSISVNTRLLAPLQTEPPDLLNATGVILLTTENLGYMSGALKDCFDRCYYPCLEHTQGLPYALVVRAGHDGTGTVRAVQTIVTGLRWRAVAEPLICRGAWQESFLDEVHDLGQAMAEGLGAGIF